MCVPLRSPPVRSRGVEGGWSVEARRFLVGFTSTDLGRVHKVGVKRWVSEWSIPCRSPHKALILPIN